jgi:putative solute:sodium symporter small subunit
VTYLHPPFAASLNKIKILTGFPLSYWLSSQFSITVYVILIFVYALTMNRVIDKKYGFEEE